MTRVKHGTIGGLLALGGAGGFCVLRWLNPDIGNGAAAMAGIVCLVVFCWGASSLLYVADKSLPGLALPVVLLAALCAMVACAVAGNLALVAVCGFAAVVLAMFLLSKNRG